MTGLRVISYGGGVQSTALLVLAATGRLGRVDAALFANVGDDSEHPKTLAYVRQVAQPWATERDYDRALAEGRVQAETRKGQRSYQRSCRRNAIAERGDEAKAIALAHPDWSPEQVADELDRQDSAAAHPAGTLATIHPIAPSKPQCAECGARHDPIPGPCPYALDAGAEP